MLGWRKGVTGKMTKGELADRILKAIGVNTRFSSATPEETSDVIRMTEDWILSNNAVGRRIGYNVAAGDFDPDDDAGIPDWSVLGVTYSVAEMACAYFEKQYTPSMLRLASQGMQTITNKTVEVQDVQYPPRMPRGYAQRGPFGWRYYQPADRVRTNNDFLSDSGDDPITS